MAEDGMDIRATSSSHGKEKSSEHGIYKWYVLAILIMINIVGAADRTVISVVAEPLKAQFLLSDKQIGLLGGMAYSLPYALAVLPMGWLVDHVNRTKLLSCTVTIWSILTGAGSVAGSIAALIAARIGVGVAEAAQGPASMSIIADTFPAKQRNTAISVYVAGASVGLILIFMLSAWLLSHFGWQAVFLVAGGPGIILAALLYFTTKEPEPGALETSKAKGSEGGIKATLLRIVKDPALRYITIALTVTTGVIYSMTVWATSFLVRSYGMTVSKAALWVGLGFGIGLVLGSLVVGPLADWLAKGDKRKLTIVPGIATVIAIVAGITMPLAHTLPISLTGMCVVAFMGGIFIPPNYTIILSLVTPNERGTVLASAKLISMLVGNSMIPFMTGAISDAVGGSNAIRVAIICTTALLLVATFCYAMIYRILDQRENAARA
jgi:MFS family permease